MLDCAHRLNLCALLGWIVLLGMVWALLGGQPASAAPGAEIIYVKPGAPDGNAGDSWATARSLQSALGTAQTGDEIWVAAGIYVPGNTVNATFQLKSGVAMYGGFVGTESSRTARDWKTNLTVLSGDVDNNDSDKVNGVVLDADNIVGNNAYHVVTANGVNAVPVVEPGGPYAATEGTPLALDGAGSSDDVGIAAYTWDCTNDGTVDDSRATPAGSSCLYPDSGSFTLRLTITDTLGVSGSATTTVSVANVAPLYTPGPNQSTFAGASKAFSLGSFTDPGAEGSWSVSIDWGDSTPATDFVVTSVGSLLTRQHSYASPGAYNVALTLDDGEDEVSGGFQVVVNPAPPGTPQVTAPANQAAAAGMAKNFALGSYADPGSAGPWSVSVDWGDNSASTQFSVTSAGALPTRSHTYVATGSYDVVVTVNDGSLSGSASFIVNVSGVVEEEQLFLPVLRRP